MADSDRSKHRRRRRGRGGHYVYDDEEVAEGAPSQPAAPTRKIILAKPDRKTSSPNTVQGASAAKSGNTESKKPHDIPALLAGDTIPTQIYLATREKPKPVKPPVKAKETVTQPAQINVKEKIKLIDGKMNWCESGLEALTDQTDFFVVGILGPQGVGKSTILSSLADAPKMKVFPSQPLSVQEVGGAHTVGIDMYVSPDRIIYLDTQPVLSISHLDKLVSDPDSGSSSHKYVTEENEVLLESVQLAAFLFTVCHVVIVVSDWFMDLSLIKFLHTCEMLKPATSYSASSSSPGDSPETLATTAISDDDYCPHLVFVLNTAGHVDFAANSIAGMQSYLRLVMAESRLKYTGGGVHTLVDGPLTSTDIVNLFLLPRQRDKDDDSDKGPCATGRFCDYTAELRNKLVSLPRQSISPGGGSLGERNWFHYAARTWDAVKKSALIAEYNRLLG